MKKYLTVFFCFSIASCQTRQKSEKRELKSDQEYPLKSTEKSTKSGSDLDLKQTCVAPLPSSTEVSTQPSGTPIEKSEVKEQKLKLECTRLQEIAEHFLDKNKDSKIDPNFKKTLEDSAHMDSEQCASLIQNNALSLIEKGMSGAENQEKKTKTPYTNQAVALITGASVLSLLSLGSVVATFKARGYFDKNIEDIKAMEHNLVLELEGLKIAYGMMPENKKILDKQMASLPKSEAGEIEVDGRFLRQYAYLQPKDILKLRVMPDDKYTPEQISTEKFKVSPEAIHEKFDERVKREDLLIKTKEKNLQVGTSQQEKYKKTATGLGIVAGLGFGVLASALAGAAAFGLSSSPQDNLVEELRASRARIDLIMNGQARTDPCQR